MGNVILDDCLQALLEAQGYLEGYVELTSYQEIFESDDPKTAKTINDNTEIESKSSNAFTRAIKAVRAIISNIVNAISDFLRKITMSKGEYDAFKAFKEAAKKDPSLANKKITVKDYRNIGKEYDKLISEIDATTRKLKSDEKTPVEDLTNRIGKFLSSTGKSVATIVTADVAMNMAKSNIDTAKAISNALKSQDGIMSQLEQELGKHGAKSYAREMSGLGKRISLQRLKAKILRQHYDSAADSFKATMFTLDRYAHKDIGFAAKNSFMARSFIKNDNTRNVLKTAVSTAMDGKKLVKDEYDHKIKKLKHDKKYPKDDAMNKSALSFFTSKGSKKDKEDK